ncbi:DUF6917 domain-containing protein [Paenibacillus sp. UNC451MF]|uniref:DUF6917 domain-containing protein n=1 Tax=Paenibacillus sp. UNC451MF TaxID=1449063 RepID=UPI000562432C|nr:hypothetical protein [Paenibacillus sp. UNC451MF]
MEKGQDPYTRGLINFDPFVERRRMIGEVVAVLEGRLSNRGLALIHARSRACRKHDIHELILTADPEAKPGVQVDQIAYLAFFEVTRGAVIVAGDRIRIGDRWSGTVVGFDETHVPNHINIVVAGEEVTGREAGLGVGDAVHIIPEGDEDELSS